MESWIPKCKSKQGELYMGGLRTFKIDQKLVAFAITVGSSGCCEN